jgi:hypothetical protein
VAPTGPHLVGDVLQRAAGALGGPGLSIDMDPRWVKKLVAAGRNDEVESYTDHLVEQCRRILLTQDIGVLAATTPLLERFAHEDKLLERINGSVQAIIWGGTHMDPDTRHLLSTEVFPEVPLIGMYGNTMMLTALLERVGLDASQPCVFDPVSPYVFLSDGLMSRGTSWPSPRASGRRRTSVGSRRTAGRPCWSRPAGRLSPCCPSTSRRRASSGSCG